MGDLRNKLRKQAETERIQAGQRAREAEWRRKHPPQPVPRCKCGHTWRDVPIMWSIETNSFFGDQELFCAACLPFKYFELVMWDAANLPDDFRPESSR